MLLCSRCGTAATAVDQRKNRVAGRNGLKENVAGESRERRTTDCARVRLAGCRERAS